MLIALDYDSTFTVDADFWRAVMAVGKLRRHTFVCVTGRDQPPMPDEPQIPCPVVCAGDKFKREAAVAAGYQVDVWIDDCPGTIEQARILSFDE